MRNSSLESIQVDIAIGINVPSINVHVSSNLCHLSFVMADPY